MVHPKIIYVPLVLLLVMTGCTSYRPIQSSATEDRTRVEAPKEDLENKSRVLEKEKAAYQKQIANQQAEIDLMTKELAKQEGNIAKSQKQVSELTKSKDELSTQIKELQDAKQKETPLKVTDLVQVKKEPVKPGKPIKGQKKEEPRELAEFRAREPKSTADAIALTKQLSDAKLKKLPPKETIPPPPKKGAERTAENIKDPKKGAQKESLALKPLEPRSVDDLAAQMKEFEEVGPKAGPPRETSPAPVKKEQVKPAKKTTEVKKEAPKEPTKTKSQPPKTIKIKVLAGDGNIASANKMSKQLGKMGYPVKSVDQAPRSDFAANTVYYGPDHRMTAEAMVKALGGGAVTRPLNWSSTFDIIVVTGRGK